MRGRKPKPVAMQIAEGDPSKHGVHRLEQSLANEIKASRGLPRCPAHLKGKARKAWKLWSEELADMDLDCRPDAQMLEGACAAYESFVECYDIIQKQGRLVAKRALNPATNSLEVVNVRPHPAIGMMNSALMVMKAFCSEFGLSPVSRLRLSIDKPDNDQDDLMAVLSRPREPRGDKPPDLIQ